jgi:hypothetical protein
MLAMESSRAISCLRTEDMSKVLETVSDGGGKDSPKPLGTNSIYTRLIAREVFIASVAKDITILQPIGKRHLSQF